jgi:hypothetical protein
MTSNLDDGRLEGGQSIAGEPKPAEAVRAEVASGPLDETERAELERLRRQAARRGGGRAGEERWPHRVRTVVATVLVVLGAALSPVAVTAVWARSQLTDTDRYVETIRPLASDPAVQSAVTADLTDLVFRYVDVAGLTRSAVDALEERGNLPPALAARLDGLAVPVAQGVHSFTEDRVGQVVRSEAFARAWVEANRSAHQQLVAALTGRGGALVISGTEVRLQLGPFLDTVKQRLVAEGFELAQRIPAVDVSVVVFRGEQVTAAQRAFDLVDRLGWWLPLVSLLLLGGGVAVARGHRRALIGAGIGLASGMLLGGAALAVAREMYLQGLPAEVLSPAAGAALFDTVVRFLRDSLRSLALIGLVAAVAGYLAGPGPAALAVRRTVAGWIAGSRQACTAAGLPRMEAFSGWTARSLGALRTGVVALGVLVVALQRYRTPELVAGTTVAVLAGLALVQFVAVGAGRERET